MIEIVINYDKDNETFKVYEPTSDTLLITTNLSESFIKLSEFLRNSGMISTDILSSSDISYHLDSGTFIAMVESNVALLKRLASAPSVFTTSAQKFGTSFSSGQNNSSGFGKNNINGGKKKSTTYSNGTFSKSTFKSSSKKFGGRG